jgi:hypothetical protein
LPAIAQGCERRLMGRFRSNQRGIVCLTLIALAIQFALAFGHVGHDRTFRLENDRKPVLGLTHDSNGLVDLYCPICTTIRISAASQTSYAPPLPVMNGLPLPVMYGQSEPMAPRQIALAERPHNFARARAPPLARRHYPVLSRYSSRNWSRADILSGYGWISDSKCGRCYARTERFRAIG